MMFKFIFSFLIAAIFGTSLIAEIVDDAQRMLNQLGYNAGPVDGAYGRKTKAALEKFYASMGKKFDGKLDANEIADLESATSKRDDFRNDLFLPTLGIDTSAGDTTLRGFQNTEYEGFKNHHKTEMLQYQKDNDITLFGVVSDDTRYGETAFFVQAPSEGCFNRKKHDCNRASGESQKRVEANYSAFKGGEHWFTVSIKLDDWEINRYPMVLTQFHSDVPQYQPIMLLRLDKKKGLWIEHVSANGFQFVEGGSEECAGGAADVSTKDKMYCPKKLEGYQLIAPDKVQKNEWYDFVYHVNFDNSDPQKEFLKVYLNGKLVVNTESTGKIVWWPTMPGVEEWENRIKFQFGIYGTKKDGAFHSAYFDEVNKGQSCEKLNIERLGYDCSSLKEQNKKIAPGWYDTPDL